MTSIVVPSGSDPTSVKNWREVRSFIKQVDKVLFQKQTHVTASSIAQAETSEGAGGLRSVRDDKSPELGADIDFRGLSASNIDHLDFNPKGAISYLEGRIFYDKVNRTFAAMNDQKEFVQQIGRELTLRAVNLTGVDIPDGSFVYVDTSSVRPAIALARADSFLTATSLIGATTHLIKGTGTPEEREGEVTIFGLIRNQDTSLCADGAKVYLSKLVGGAWTKDPPEYPSYQIEVGMVVKSHPTKGEVLVHIRGDIHDVILNDYNGIALESISLKVDSDGAVVKGLLERSGGGDLTLRFAGGFSNFICTPSPAELTLVPGTDSNPGDNYIYIDAATQTLSVSTTNWPVVEHIKIAYCSLWSAATTQTVGAWVNQNHTDHIAGQDGIGHRQHVSYWIRSKPPVYKSGAKGSLVIVPGSPDDAYVTVTQGIISQLHDQLFPAVDMSSGDDIHIINDPISPYRRTSNLNTITTDAIGGSLGNKFFSIVIGGVQNKSGEESHIMGLLPTGSYNTEADLKADVSSYATLSMPPNTKSTGFLISQFNIKHSSAGGGSWQLISEIDLTEGTTGVGGGGGGVTTFLQLTDTPAAHIDGHLLAGTPSGVTYQNPNIYALLAGRLGGQTVVGGTATTEELTLVDNSVDGNALTMTQIRAKMDELGDDLTPRLSGDLDADGFAINAAGAINGTEVNVALEGDAQLTVSRYSGDPNSPRIICAKARGTIASPTAVLDGDFLGVYRGRGYTGVAMESGAQIDFIAAQDWSVAQRGCALEFYTVENSTTSVERRGYIDHDGEWIFDNNNLSGINILSATSLGKNIDFGGFQALALVTHKGTIANIPNTGGEIGAQWYYAEDIKTLFFFETTWRPFISFGEVTMYVDKTGSDALGKGYAAGTGAFLTISAAIGAMPPTSGAGVEINIGPGVWAEDVTIKGKRFSSDGSLVLRGTVSSLLSAAMDSSVDSTPTTQATVTDTSAFGAIDYSNKLIHIQNVDDMLTGLSFSQNYRIIDSNSSSVLTIVGTTEGMSGVYTIYDWDTVIDGLFLVDEGQKNVQIEFLHITGSEPIENKPTTFLIRNFSSVLFLYSKIIPSAVAANISMRLWIDAALAMYFSYVENTTTISSTGILLQQEAKAIIRASKLYGGGEGRGVWLSLQNLISFLEGCVADDFEVGLFAHIGGTIVLTGGPFFKNNGIGVDAEDHVLFRRDLANFSGNTIDVLDADSFFALRALSADPPDPPAGSSTEWLSDGTGSGDVGDLMIKINNGVSTKTITLVDFSTS